MPITYAALSPEDVRRHRDELAEVYGNAFAVAGSEEQRRFINEQLPRHMIYAGFRLIAANEDAALVGFVYGYHSTPGMWWHDLVRSAMSPPVADSWLRDALEFVELAVHPDHHGRGIGGHLHDLILADAPEARALLSTAQRDSAAMALYRKRGWVLLVEPFRYPDSAATNVIMGFDLCHHRPPHPNAPPEV